MPKWERQMRAEMARLIEEREKALDGEDTTADEREEASKEEN